MCWICNCFLPCRNGIQSFSNCTTTQRWWTWSLSLTHLAKTNRCSRPHPHTRLNHTPNPYPFPKATKDRIWHIARTIWNTCSSSMVCRAFLLAFRILGKIILTNGDTEWLKENPTLQHSPWFCRHGCRCSAREGRCRSWTRKCCCAAGEFNVLLSHAHCYSLLPYGPWYCSLISDMDQIALFTPSTQFWCCSYFYAII